MDCRSSAADSILVEYEQNADLSANESERISYSDRDMQLNTLQGNCIGSYLLDRLGSCSAMGVSYLANRNDGRIKQRVIFKFLYPSIVSALGLDIQHDMFLVSKIRNAHIQQVLDAGVSEQGLHYLMLEYVEGVAIDQYLERKHLSLRQKIELFLQLCDALSAAHSLQIEHGDLKPANILVTAQGQVKLVGFGIAQQFYQEQMSSEPLPVHCDQFALGLLLYLMLCDRTSDWSDSVIATEFQIKQQSIPALWPRIANRKERWIVRYQLEPVIQRALKGKSTDRFPSVMSLKQELQCYLTQHPMSHQQDFYWRGGKWLRRHPLLAMLLCMLGAGTSALAWQNQLVLTERNNAQQIAFHLKQLFRHVDPHAEGKLDISARDVLDRGVQIIQQDSDISQPLRWQLLQTLGESRFGIGDYVGAEQVMRNLLRQQISAGQVQPETVLFICKIWEFFKSATLPAPEEFAAIGNYFSQLPVEDLLTPVHAEALLSFLTSNWTNTEFITGYQQLEPYLPELYAMFPDSRWTLGALFKAEGRWEKDNDELRDGTLSKAQWLGHRQDDLNLLSESIAKAEPMHPHYAHAVVVSHNFKRIIYGTKARRDLDTHFRQLLENAVEQRTQQLGIQHASVTNGLEQLVEGSSYSGNWLQMEQDLQRLANHMTKHQPQIKWSAYVFNGLRRLYERQGRLADLLELNQLLLGKVRTDSAAIDYIELYSFLGLADSLTYFEQKEALAELLPVLQEKLNKTTLDEGRQQYLRLQLQGRQRWVRGTFQLEDILPDGYLQQQSGWETQLYTELALLSGHGELAERYLRAEVTDLEFELNFCPPTYCLTNLKVSLIPLKLAEIYLKQGKQNEAQELLTLVERYGRDSNNSPTNYWLQQLSMLCQNYQLSN
jgi:hypothetical protein